jgi:Cu+-exporting ATPase
MGQICVHCGEDCGSNPVMWDGKPFCCHGCKTVYQLLNEKDMKQYYEFEQLPGIKVDTPSNDQKYAFLDLESVKEKLIEFSDGEISKVTLHIPSIHCASCIWLLENLNTLNPDIQHSFVNFPRKEVSINFLEKNISLRQVVELLAAIHYIPELNLDSLDKEKKGEGEARSLLMKIGVAGFAFMNIMVYNLPEYFQGADIIPLEYRRLFGWLSVGLSIPVIVYCASDYFMSAYKGIKHRFVSVDILVAIGIVTLFLQSLYDIVTGAGIGYLDSLSGLVFFLLLGKWYQGKTYEALSFERDYKSYFPIAITSIQNGEEKIVEIKDIRPGDRLLIHNQEIVPVDSILIKGRALIDYSFVTGESMPVEKQVGDKILAGGKQIGDYLEMDAVKDVDNSYLTKLWSRDIFDKEKGESIQTITDKVSQYFTFGILSIALAAGLYWYFVSGMGTAVWVISAVLIVACPCALALSAPFAFGNMLRNFGYDHFYLKNAQVLEDLSLIDTIIFDKTGTITEQSKYKVSQQHADLPEIDKRIIKSMAKASNHPLSRLIYQYLAEIDTVDMENLLEITGKGIIANYNEDEYRLGSASFVKTENEDAKTKVFFSKNGEIIEVFVFEAEFRTGIREVFEDLDDKYQLIVLSGDNDSEREVLQSLLPPDVEMHFNQSIHDKTDFIEALQNEGKRVMMIGDGLNDAGALRQSNIGVAVSEDTNVFTPSSDIIMKASRFGKLPRYLRNANKTKRIIYMSFTLAIAYNIFGLGFAISNLLTPIFAAILMPISSISIVVFVTFMTNRLKT